jgi:hypothetical protein
MGGYMQSNRHTAHKQSPAISRHLLYALAHMQTGLYTHGQHVWLLLAWLMDSRLIAPPRILTGYFFLHKSVPAPKGGTPSQNKGGGGIFMGGWGFAAAYADWPTRLVERRPPTIFI